MSQPQLPDPRHLSLPTDTLSPITHALSDLAHATPPPPPQTPPTSTSPTHISQRLALRLHSETPLPPLSSSTSHSALFTSPTSPNLARETALVGALAVWAASFLKHDDVKMIYDKLHQDVCKAIERVIGGGFEGVFGAFETATSARRGVLNAALSRRYGGLENAVTAAMIAGGGVVLYVREKRKSGERVCLPTWEQGEDGEIGGVVEWKRVCAGVAVVEQVEVGGVDEIRKVVGGRLREVVKGKGLAPVLVVLEVEGDSEMMGGGGVLRAVCEGYGVWLHVEGEGVGMILGAGEEVGAVVGVGDSVLVEVGRWFGRGLGVGVVLGGVQGERGAVDGRKLGSVMALWYLVERVNLERCGGVLKAACEGGRGLVEALYSVPHLLEVKMAGCGKYVLVSYAAVLANAEMRTAVNRAMLAYFERKHADVKHLLVLGSHMNREWLLFSPMRVMKSGVDAAPLSVDVVKAVSKDLVYAARRCELVVNGKAAFMSQMRQCQDIEVESITPPSHGASSVPLFFAALRVTPFGEVSRNGHWIRDEEMSIKVEKYTYALASLLEERGIQGFEALIQDSADENNEVALIYVGPVLMEKSLDANDRNKGIKAQGGSGIAAISSENAALAEEWDVDEFSAQEMALQAAESITAVLNSALSVHDDVLDQEDDDEAQGKNAEAIEDGQAKHANGVKTAPDHSEQISHDLSPEFGAQNSEQTAYQHEDYLQTTEQDIKPEGIVVEDFTKKTLNQSLDSDGSRQSTGKADKQTRKAGIWGLLFGDSIDDADSNSSLDSSKGLEDDYFRP